MLDFKKLIDFQYLLAPQPGYDFFLFVPLIVTFGVLFAAGVILAFTPVIKKQTWAKMLGQWLRWFGFLGALITLLRYENIQYLGMRINYYFLTLGFLVWLAFIARDLIASRTPVTNEQIIRQNTYEKYLPRAKKRQR